MPLCNVFFSEFASFLPRHTAVKLKLADADWPFEAMFVSSMDYSDHMVSISSSFSLHCLVEACIFAFG